MSAFDFFAPRASHSWKFTNPGDTHTGTITEVSDARQATEYGSNELAYWDKERTRPKMQVAVTLTRPSVTRRTPTTPVSAPSGLLRTAAPAPSSPPSVRQCTRQAQAPSTLVAS